MVSVFGASGVVEYLSFPGLGLERWFHIDKTISLFGGKFQIAWYGILITLGMILAFSYALYRALKVGIKTDDVLDIALFTIIFGVVGARLYYVIFQWQSYASYPGSIGDKLLNMVAIWRGGLAIPGGLIAGILTIVLVCRIKKIRILTFLDCTAPGVMLAQAVGRWGNFFNIEAYGSETTLPWRMGIAEIYRETIVSSRYVHPTFLYECLWNLLGFALVNIFYNKKKFNGQIFLFYISWYSIGRFCIESLRTDALRLGGIRITQLLCAVCAVIGVALMIWLWKKQPEFVRLEAVSVKEEAPSSTIFSEEDEEEDNEDDCEDNDAENEATANDETQNTTDGGTYNGETD